MALSSRQEYLAAIRKRYHAATKIQKGIILDEFCAICGYHRKPTSFIRRSNSRRNNESIPGTSRNTSRHKLRTNGSWLHRTSPNMPES